MAGLVEGAGGRIACVLASGNAGKRREFEAILGPRWELVPQAELGIEPAEETGRSFRENAILKAVHAARLSGRAAIADDSGLAVDALDGAPGIYSARYAGPAADDAANNAKLLAALADVAPGERGATFHCVIALVTRPDGAPLVAEGQWRGEIALAPRGERGFGYDPLFLVPGSGLTSAELDPAGKNRISHRAAALRNFERLLAGSGLV